MNRRSEWPIGGGVDDTRHGLQSVVRNRIAGGRVPDHAHLLPPVQRDQDDIAGLEVEVRWDPVVERPGERIGKQHRHPSMVTL